MYTYYVSATVTD